MQGEVVIADIEFAGIPVKSQALLSAIKADFDNLFSLGVYGILGLGFDTLSPITSALQVKFEDTRGRSVLSNMCARPISFAVSR